MQTGQIDWILVKAEQLFPLNTCSYCSYIVRIRSLAKKTRYLAGLFLLTIKT